MTISRKCARCNRIKNIHGRNLCVSCYDYERRHNNLGNYQTRQVGENKRFDDCLDCYERKHIYGQDRCHKCYNKWYMSQPENKERHAKRERRRRQKNPEKCRELDRARNKTEKRQQWKKKYHQRYYADNSDKLRQYQVEWRQNNKEQFSEYMRCASMRRKEAEGFTTTEQWQKLVRFYCPNNECLCCGNEFDRDTLERKLSQDHIIPISWGGSHWPENIQPLCYSCNCSKGNNHATDYRSDDGEFARSLT